MHQTRLAPQRSFLRWMMPENHQKNLHYTHGLTPKRVTSGGAHLRGLVSEQYSNEETWQADNNTVSNFTGEGIEPQTFLTNSDVLKHCVNRPKC